MRKNKYHQEKTSIDEIKNNINIANRKSTQEEENQSLEIYQQIQFTNDIQMMVASND